MRRAFLVACILMSLSGSAYASPRIEFHSRSVVIGDLTPSGSVYVLGIAREPRGDHTAVVPYETTVPDGDGDGRIVWELDSEVARRSIWLAVDLSTGDAAVAAPPGYPVNPIDLTGEHLKRDAARAVAQIAVPGTHVEVVVVRPRTGVWRGTVGLHSQADEARERDKVTVSTANLHARTGTIDAAPKHLKKGDVVFFLDSYTATYGLITVGE